MQLSGNEKVLEIGAGTGRQAQAMLGANLCRELWLLEPSDKMLKVAHKKIPQATPILGYAEAMPFSGAKFDRAYAVDSLHHWDDQYQGLLEVRRILKPKGIFVLIELDPRTRWGHFISLFERVLRMGSILYSPGAMKEMQRQAGLRLVEWRHLDSGTYIMKSARD